MSASNRPILKLPKRSDEHAEQDFTPPVLDFFEVLLPCRTFNITYKVSEKGAVSFTSEFLLRLLHSADGMREAEVAKFFGFSGNEMEFVLSEVIGRDYAYREEGRVWITPTGQSLFLEDQSTPQIFKVTQRSNAVGFDLLSLAPQPFEHLPDYARTLPALTVNNIENLSNATERIPQRFRKHFFEIVSPKEGRSLEKQGFLYSVDDVEARTRFFSIVPIFIVAVKDRSGSAEPDLMTWRSGQELDDRGSVADAVLSFMKKRQVSARADDHLAYEQLTSLAPDFFQEYMRREGLSVERFYKVMQTRAGELRADRPTVPIVGSLFTPANEERLHEALRYAIRSPSILPLQVLWQVPSVPWGVSQALPATIDDLRKRLSDRLGADPEAQPIRFTALCRAPVPPHIEAAFDDVVILKDSDDVAPALEILYIPTLMMVALVHAPINTKHGIPIPIGVMSFDANIVGRTQTLLLEKIDNGAVAAALHNLVQVPSASPDQQLL